jgi:fructose-1,6-bisphosphatase/inositol monophosphatase family enzyme
LLIEEAGGRIGALAGGALDLIDGSVLGSNGKLHASLQALLATA